MYNNLIVITCLLAVLAPMSAVRTIYRLNAWDSGTSGDDDVQPYAAGFSILMTLLAVVALGFAAHALSNMR